MSLFPYQAAGAEFLAKTKRALLADEMGLGKSAQAISACDLVGARDRCVLVVCPASLRENWKQEFVKFSKTGITPIVVSYNTAGALCTEPPAGDMWDVLILDESHYLKNPKAKRTQQVFGARCDGVGGLVEKAKRVFCLSGTPTPNSPNELWPMLRAVMPDAIKSASPKPLAYWPFVQKYCVTQDTGFGIKIIRGKNLGDLKERIAPFILRRKKDDVLKDLPPIRFDTLALEGKASALLREDVQMIRQALEEDGVAGLKAIAPHVAQLRRITGMAKVEAAKDWIAEFLEGSTAKLVVFAHHKDVLSDIARCFEGDYAMVAGETPQDARQAAVDRFQKLDRCRLFLGQIQAAGTGLTLTAASDVLFVESSWTPSDNQQAAMRVHRIGQRNACLVRFAMLAGSIDEDIQRAVMRKTTDISRLFS